MDEEYFWYSGREYAIISIVIDKQIEISLSINVVTW